MKKVTVADAAEYFGVSKEAIHNRIRRGSLEVVLENGIKMVCINPSTTNKPVRKQSQVREASKSDERYYKLLQEQNEKLQAKVEKLEGETRTLRDQKELMLIEERKKIEAIYKEKDEQLKNILSTLSSQFMLLQEKPVQEILESEALEVEIEEEKREGLTTLKKYLKRLNFSDKKREKIKARFLKKAKKDERIIMIGSKCYVDTFKYEYKDLL